MKTELFGISNLSDAAQLLRAGELVAFPTETVYGLGANALNASAVQKIFAAKGRPSDNPLIVHLASHDQLESVVREVNGLARSLIQAFWPGPLTIVMPKQKGVSELVTAGLDTVAVRVPNHPIALELLRLADVPIAAPSANRSGRPSATTWQAVSEDLNGLVAGIVCGSPTKLGLESTVVDVVSYPPRLLRPGGVSFETLQAIAPDLVAYSSQVSDLNSNVNSPGLRHAHYQPRARVVITDADKLDHPTELFTSNCNYIGLSVPPKRDRFVSVRVYDTIDAYASNLFDFFRRSDADGVSTIFCEKVDEIGIGTALMDRLRRASET